MCKAKLQEELGLEVRDDRPLMVMVTRLTRQKGMDLVMYALDRILAGGVQVAVLGTGDRDYEDGLRYFQDKYPGTMAARIEFDPALSQRMYAAADMFLMPSKFEPCGLSQIIAMRYGTLPIVRETGGLKDSIHDLPARVRDSRLATLTATRWAMRYSARRVCSGITATLGTSWSRRP